LNKLFTVLGGKFKFSAQDSDLEYLFWKRKNPPVSSDLKPPLGQATITIVPRWALSSRQHRTLVCLLLIWKPTLRSLTDKWSPLLLAGRALCCWMYPTAQITLSRTPSKERVV
jgi:hypothetical protein